MSKFSSEMKQMPKKWLHKLAPSPPICVGNKLSQGHIRHLTPHKAQVRAVSSLGFRNMPRNVLSQIGEGDKNLFES